MYLDIGCVWLKSTITKDISIFLGNWLQVALKDDLGGSDKTADGEEPEGNLQRAQSIYNTYKTRVDELGKLKYKLDNVIGYGRDLLMHLSPAAAQQLT